MNIFYFEAGGTSCLYNRTMQRYLGNVFSDRITALVHIFQDTVPEPFALLHILSLFYFPSTMTHCRAMSFVNDTSILAE